MAFPLHPLTLEAVAAWPGVHSTNLETELPRSAVLPLTLGTCAHPEAVGFAVLPATAVRSTVVEIKPPAAAHPRGFAGTPWGGCWYRRG